MIPKVLRRRLVSRTGQRIRATCPPSVAAEQDHPRLHVWREYPGLWRWEITGPDGEILDDSYGLTHVWALNMGLAALEVASVR